MRVNEAMTRDVCIVRPDHSVEEAARMMAAIDVGLLPVGEDDRLVGMITDRDIALRTIGEGKGPATEVAHVMTQDVKYCYEDEDTAHVSRNMAEQQVRRLPVLTRDKRLVGILSLADMAQLEAGVREVGSAYRGISQPGGPHSTETDAHREQAAGFSFANANLTKAWVNYRSPSLNIGALLEAHRKNAAALIKANQVAFDGLKTLAQRQGDLVKTTVDDYSKVTSDVLAPGSFEERVTNQADAARHIYLSTVARFRELSDIAVKANVTAVDILNARVAEAFDEFRALFAAPVARTTATSEAPTSVIADPVAVVEEVAPVEDAVAPVEREPSVTAAPTPAPKTAAPAAKVARRPTSRG